jgi:uncharacterized membrane protein (Fun14 family)
MAKPREVLINDSFNTNQKELGVGCILAFFVGGAICTVIVVLNDPLY